MHVRILAAVLVALILAIPARAQSLQYDLAIGYQWQDVSGNKEVHRTQTGDREGLRLDAFNLLLVDTAGAPGLDRLRITAAGLGGGPDSRLRIDASRGKVYNLRLNWVRSEVFNSLPGYANPLLESGSFVGQHSLDRRRQNLDLDLEVFPGRAFSPLLGYSRSRYAGPAHTTYHFGQDEFRLTSDLDETVHEYRVGASFAAGDFRGTVMQGWRSFNSHNAMALVAGAGAGNNTRPVLGHPVFADVLALHTRSRGHTPFLNAFITGHLVGRARVVGSFARSEAEVSADESLDGAGHFASFALQRFFGSASQFATGRADSESWRGEARVEVEIARGVDLHAGYRSSHRELDGHSFVTTRYFDTVNFSGAFPADITRVLEASTAWERDEDVLEAKLLGSPASWLRLWASAGKVSQDITIVPALAEIVVPGGQGGTFNRDIDRFAGGALVELGMITLGGDWSHDESDQTVIRTDYSERTKVRGRVTFKLSDTVRLVGSAQRIESSNPAAGVGYDSEVKHWAAAVEVKPLEAVTVRAGYDSFRTDSRLIITRPQDLGSEPSLYAEDGESLEASMDARFGRFSLGLGASRYRNRGNMAFDLDRTSARFDVEINASLGFYGQFERREYSEEMLPVAGFDADRYGLFLRWAGK